VSQKPLTEAVAEYVAMKEHEREQDMLSEPYLVRMKRDLKRLQKHFPGATVGELTGARLIGYFEARRAALKTYNNRRGIVSTFLKFALQRDWITDNPLVKIPARRIRRRRGGAITFAAAAGSGLDGLRRGHIIRPPCRSSPYASSPASGPACAPEKFSGSGPSM
jgi:hypothetical protein